MPVLLITDIRNQQKLLNMKHSNVLEALTSISVRQSNIKVTLEC